MSHFRYVAATVDNEVRRGSLEAASEGDVVQHLQRQGLVPLAVRPLRHAQRRGGRRRRTARRRRPGRAELVAFTEQLAALLDAGLSLDRALRALERTSRGTLAELVDDLRGRVRDGSSLSEALDHHERLFPPFYRRVVQAGESSGTLAGQLSRLAENLGRARELRERIASALVYPAVLTVLTMVSLGLLIGFVLPRFVPLFESLGAELPWTTRVMLMFSVWVREWAWLVPCAGVVIAAFVYRHRNSGALRRWLNQSILSMPVLGSLVRRIELARFARTMGTMVVNGIGVPLAMRTAADGLHNRILARAVLDARDRVKQGERLADALDRVPGIPPLLIEVVALGEDSASLGAMLLRGARDLEHGVATTLERLMSLLVPALTLLLAVVIGLVILSIMTPILRMNELVL